MPTKVHLRQQLLAQRAALTQTAIRQKSAAIAAQACATQAFGGSQTVMVYLALQQEVQTALIIEAAHCQHKRVVVPVITDHKLLPVILPPYPTKLRRGPYGILEPQEATAVVPLEEIDCVFLPGVAFDNSGGRLGFGGGYYDRFLAPVSAKVFLCGLAFSMQIVPRVPLMPYDICMHALVTEQGYVSCIRALPADERL